MDHGRLVDRLLNEIATARAGITANYARLWRDRSVDAGTPPEVPEGDDVAPETPPSSGPES